MKISILISFVIMLCLLLCLYLTYPEFNVIIWGLSAALSMGFFGLIIEYFYK
jgi:hypothetical protein